MMQSPVTIACLQMEPRIGQVAENVAKSLTMIEEAHRQGASIVVLPELCNTGYVFETRDEAFRLSEPVPDGPTTRAWQEIAARLGLIIVAGITEREGAKLFNSAVAVGPDGYVGTYRKNHLWAAENLYFEPGDLGVPVWHTRVGRIAAAICYDGWFPEVFRLAAVQGADLVCIPTNWVPMPEQPGHLPVMANILAMSAAHSNSLVIAAADRIGIERGQPFLGRSIIVGHTGWPLAGPASADREEILVAAVDLSDGRQKRSLNAFNQPLRDRRTDLYAESLGASVKRCWY
jgi:N-carbamoylputrescine amidase